MFAAAGGHSTLGIPKKVGKEFTEGTGHGKYKGALKGLPEHKAAEKKKSQKGHMKDVLR